MGRNGPKCPKYGSKWQECGNKSGNGAQMWVEMALNAPNMALDAPNMALNGRNAAIEVVMGHKCGSKWY